MTAQKRLFMCKPECGCEILDSDKPAMLRKPVNGGSEEARNWRSEKCGFWINSLYSVFVTWADAAEEFLKSKDDPEMLQNFVNSWLAEPWEDTKLKTNEDTRYGTSDGCSGTDGSGMGEDPDGWRRCAGDEFYYTIRAWGEHSTSQNIAHGQVLDFFSIERIMNGEFVTEDGRRMVVDLAPD